MDCYLIGAGNNSCVIIDYLLEEKYKILGIFDDDVTKDFNYKNIKILDSTKNINKFKLKSYIFFYTIGDPVIRRKIMEKIKIQLIYPNFIHKSCIISDTIKLGKGNIIYPYTCIKSNTIINDFNLINTHTNIGHDVCIGNNNVISPNVTICGNVNIQNNNFFGANCCIIPKITIGSNNVIGSCSNVIRNINNNIKTYGNPNKINIPLI